MMVIVMLVPAITMPAMAIDDDVVDSGANGLYYYTEDVIVEGRDISGNVVAMINLSQETITLPSAVYCCVNSVLMVVTNGGR